MLDLSIIIPFKNRSDMTSDCIITLFKYGETVKEVILVSNNSSENELNKIKSLAEKYPNARVLEYNHPFNFQAINNWAAKKATSRVIMLLNNDIELTPRSQGVLAKMYELAIKPDIGAVGAVLLYDDQKTIQHAGVYLIPGGTADHLYIGSSLSSVVKKISNHTLPFDITENLQVTAVTAASVMVERKKFEKIKGLNEDFIVCGGDVDLCLRLEERGYKNILLGSRSGIMIHKESKSRSLTDVPYGDFVESYKSYIKHFSIKSGDHYLPWKDVSNVK